MCDQFFFVLIMRQSIKSQKRITLGVLCHERVFEEVSGFDLNL